MCALTMADRVFWPARPMMRRCGSGVRSPVTSRHPLRGTPAGSTACARSARTARTCLPAPATTECGSGIRATGDQQTSLAGRRGQRCAFSANGQDLLASASDDRTVRIWDPVTGNQQTSLAGHTGWVRGVCASTMATGCFRPVRPMMRRCGSGIRPPAQNSMFCAAMPAECVGYARSARTARTCLPAPATTRTVRICNWSPERSSSILAASTVVSVERAP